MLRCHPCRHSHPVCVEVSSSRLLYSSPPCSLPVFPPPWDSAPFSSFSSRSSTYVSTFLFLYASPQPLSSPGRPRLFGVLLSVCLFPLFVSGYESFLDHAVNPSHEVAVSLNDTCDTVFLRHPHTMRLCYRGVSLPVTTEGSNWTASALQENPQRWDGILHLVRWRGHSRGAAINRACGEGRRGVRCAVVDMLAKRLRFRCCRRTDVQQAIAPSALLCAECPTLFVIVQQQQQKRCRRDSNRLRGD